MSDKDDLPARGIPAYSLVDEFGVSTDGTSASMNTIRSRGMQPICEVNASGVASSGSTMNELRSRGIRFYCAVTENAVTSGGVTLDTLRSRGIPFFCPVDVNGIAVGGTATIKQLSAKGVPYACLLDSLGGAGGSSPAIPTTPVLAMDPLWTTTDATPDFIADFDDTVVAGDDFRLQIQAAGGDWSVLLSNTTHTLTAPEDAANEVSLSNGSLANANYEARCNVTHGSTSNWSNTVSFTVAAVTAGNNVYPYLLV